MKRKVCACFKCILNWIKNRYRGFKIRLRKLPLFASIIIWVFLAICIFVALEWLWTGWYIFEVFSLSGEGTDRLDTVRVALIVVGGIGAVSYLVIKYQERNAAKRAENREDDDQIERAMINAVTLLGDTEAPARRIAGVYALTDIADTHKGHFKR